PTLVCVRRNPLVARAQHVPPRRAVEQTKAEPVVAIADGVDQQAGRGMDTRNDDVDVPVVVDVAERRTAADLEALERRSRLRGDVLETAVAQIAEEELALAVGKPVRSALLDRFDRAVDREQIEPAVVVEIDPRGAKAGVPEAHRTDSRRGAHVFEEAGAEI